MHSNVKCALCLSLACVCVGGPVLAKDFDAGKAKDFSKGVALAVTTSASASDVLYVTNTMGGPDFKAVMVAGVKFHRWRLK